MEKAEKRQRKKVARQRSGGSILSRISIGRRSSQKPDTLIENDGVLRALPYVHSYASLSQRDAEDELSSFFLKSAPDTAENAAASGRSSAIHDGLFLVRARQNGDFFLCYTTSGHFKHVPIVRGGDGSLSIKGQDHSMRCVSLDDLIRHLQQCAEGISCCLSEGAPRKSQISEVAAFPTARRIELLDMARTGSKSIDEIADSILATEPVNYEVAYLGMVPFPARNLTVDQERGKELATMAQRVLKSKKGGSQPLTCAVTNVGVRIFQRGERRLHNEALETLAHVERKKSTVFVSFLYNKLGVILVHVMSFVSSIRAQKFEETLDNRKAKLNKTTVSDVRLTPEELASMGRSGKHEVPGAPRMLLGDVVHACSHEIGLDPVKVLTVFFNRFDQAKNAQEFWDQVREKHPGKSNMAIFNAVKKKYQKDPIAYYKDAVPAELRWDTVDDMARMAVCQILSGESEDSPASDQGGKSMDLIQQPALLVFSSEGIRIIDEDQREVSKNIYVNSLREARIVGVDQNGKIAGDRSFSKVRTQFLVLIEEDTRSSTKTLHIFSGDDTLKIQDIDRILSDCREASFREAKAREGNPFAATGIIQVSSRGSEACALPSSLFSHQAPRLSGLGPGSPAGRASSAAPAGLGQGDRSRNLRGGLSRESHVGLWARRSSQDTRELRGKAAPRICRRQR